MQNKIVFLYFSLVFSPYKTWKWLLFHNNPFRIFTIFRSFWFNLLVYVNRLVEIKREIKNKYADAMSVQFLISLLSCFSSFLFHEMHLSRQSKCVYPTQKFWVKTTPGLEWYQVENRKKVPGRRNYLCDRFLKYGIHYIGNNDCNEQYVLNSIQGNDLPAICSVAFRLTAMPAVLFASHQYTPESCSRLFCNTLIEWRENEKKEKKKGQLCGVKVDETEQKWTHNFSKNWRACKILNIYIHDKLVDCTRLFMIISELLYKTKQKKHYFDYNQLNFLAFSVICSLCYGHF